MHSPTLLSSRHIKQIRTANKNKQNKNNKNYPKNSFTPLYNNIRIHDANILLKNRFQKTRANITRRTHQIT